MQEEGQLPDEGRPAEQERGSKTHLVLDAHARRELARGEVETVQGDLKLEGTLCLVKLQKKDDAMSDEPHFDRSIGTRTSATMRNSEKVAKPTTVLKSCSFLV